MKKVFIVNQNKGGVGKSFLAALILSKNIDNDDFLLIDIDSGNRSSFKRFNSNPLTKDKVNEFSLLTGDENIDKDRFNDLFNAISAGDSGFVILDLGGNESRELLALIEILSPEIAKEYFLEKNLDVEFIAVVKSGQIESLDYLKKLSNVLKDYLPINCYINSNSISSANDSDYLNLINNCKRLKINVREFGKAPSGGIRERISKHVDSGFTTDLQMSKGLFASMVNSLEI